ncbi:hypothetical protein LXA43DRAFT_549950 [Ganoderma leucocontextum]|nr:hypothetical protein LXA43DRAFT_549950 [Ganoderma leucocontextum]
MSVMQRSLSPRLLSACAILLNQIEVGVVVIGLDIWNRVVLNLRALQTVKLPALSMLVILMSRPIATTSTSICAVCTVIRMHNLLYGQYWRVLAYMGRSNRIWQVIHAVRSSFRWSVLASRFVLLFADVALLVLVTSTYVLVPQAVLFGLCSIVSCRIRESTLPSCYFRSACVDSFHPP